MVPGMASPDLSFACEFAAIFPLFCGHPAAPAIDVLFDTQRVGAHEAGSAMWPRQIWVLPANSLPFSCHVTGQACRHEQMSGPDTQSSWAHSTALVTTSLTSVRTEADRSGSASLRRFVRVPAHACQAGRMPLPARVALRAGRRRVRRVNAPSRARS